MLKGHPPRVIYHRIYVAYDDTGFKGDDPCMMNARTKSMADASERVDACTTCHFRERFLD